MTKKSQRIYGFDFARGLAIIGMVIVNFKVVMVAETDSLLYQLVGLLSGKAAALFVVLAGVGMTLMYQRAKREKKLKKIREIKLSLLKRAVFLFVVGLSYYFIWPADILHYYGLYLSIGILFLPLSRKWLQIISLLIIVGYTVLLAYFNYETGWDWNVLEYTDFFTLNGFFRNLFLNGFHPVLPWLAFLLTGIWVGRINFNNEKERKQVTKFSLIAFIIFKGISLFLVKNISSFTSSEASDIEYLLGTSPMPPLFFYMITASSLAIFVISLSVYVANKFRNSFFVQQLISTGQLALSNYFFHVVVGMLFLELFYGKLEYAFSIEFTLAYAILFSVVTVVLSHLWCKKFKHGPLEYLMRKITN